MEWVDTCTNHYPEQFQLLTIQMCPMNQRGTPVGELTILRSSDLVE